MGTKAFNRGSKRRRKARAEKADLGPSAPELSAEQAREAQEALLVRIAEGAAFCRRMEAALSQHPGPDPETLIKIYRVLLLKLSAEVQVAPQLRPLFTALLRPVMEWARLDEKRREREWMQQKAAARQKKQTGGTTGTEPALSPGTLEKIERELRLF